MNYLDHIKYIRVQIAKSSLNAYPEECHTIVEFVNGSRSCSCGIERGNTPSLRGSWRKVDGPTA